MNLSTEEVPSHVCGIQNSETGDLVGFGLLPSNNDYRSAQFVDDFANSAILGRENVELSWDSKLSFSGAGFRTNAFVDEGKVDELRQLFGPDSSLEVRELKRPSELGDGENGFQYLRSEYARGGSLQDAPLSTITL